MRNGPFQDGSWGGKLQAAWKETACRSEEAGGVAGTCGGENNVVWLIGQLLKESLKVLVWVMGLWGWDAGEGGGSFSNTKTMVSR